MLKLERVAAGLAVAITVLCAAPAGRAQNIVEEPRKVELAKQLFAEMHMDRMMMDLSSSLIPAMLKEMQKEHPTLSKDQIAIVEEAATGAEKDFYAKVEERSIPLYASTFTETELQDVVDFYATPSGQAMLAKLPVLTAKVTPMVIQLMPELETDIMRRICSKMECGKAVQPATASKS